MYFLLAVLLRDLDALSTEDSVMGYMKQLADQLANANAPIKSIRIGKDSLTNTSRGVCYVEMNSVVDAMFLHNQLLGEPPVIDDKLVSVSYYRPPMASQHSSHHHSNNKSSASSSGRDNVPTKAASAALEAAQWSHKGRQGIGNQYSHDDIERMAEYSASMYAKSSSDKAHYLEYYRNYYKNGGDPNAGAKSAAAGQRSSPTPSEDDRPPGASASATSSEREKVTVNGREYPRYPTPDVSTYTYDEGTGYYYDASTQLYYDSNSQYYLNAKNNKYVYWSPDHHTFLPAPETSSDTATDAATDAANEYKEQLAAANGNGNEKKKDPSEKKDKVKTAKRIAKDMEKWAKTLNQKAAKAQQQPQQPQLQQQMSQPQAQSISIGVSSAAPPQAMSISAAQGGSAKSNTEDLAFSMLQNKNDRERSVASKSPSGGLARLTGYGSDDNEDEDNSVGGASGDVDEQQFTDLSKLACLLCKRAFPSRDKLMK